MIEILIGLFVTKFMLEIAATLLNFKNLDKPLPQEFSGIYVATDYAKGLLYQREQGRLSLLCQTVDFLAFMTFWYAGGFVWAFDTATAIALSIYAGGQSVLTVLLFWAILILLKQLLSLPFALYSTFSIEARFGFNKSTPLVFCGDLLKGVLLSILIGAPLGSGILWFLGSFPDQGWLWAWSWITAFQILLLFIAPVWIMPLFNKYTPLPEGDLKKSIQDFAQTVQFPLEGIYVMDGSKRSSKANAFFTGFGRHRRLVLFDTLIEQQSRDELLAVVAHEVGHFKLKHIWRSMAFSFISSFTLFWSFGFFMRQEQFFTAFAFGSETLENSLYRAGIGLVLFSIILSPLMRLVGIWTHWRSRVHEFEADAYSVQSGQKPSELISSLKKLSKNSSSHLNPHWLRVLLDYTHPPILERVAALRVLGPE